MVRLMAAYSGEHFCSIPLAIGLFVSVIICVALCANHARKVSRKYLADTSDPKVPPRSPIPSRKKLISAKGSKAIPFINKKKNGDQECEAETKSNSIERFGEGGLWQNSILMGEKCQPPEFSGVIYYDSRGTRVSELPRSPRMHHPSLSSSNFPVVRDAN